MNDTEMKAFDEAVKPVHEWLCKYGHPHMMVVVEQGGAQVFEGICSTPMKVPDLTVRII